MEIVRFAHLVPLVQFDFYEWVYSSNSSCLSHFLTAPSDTPSSWAIFTLVWPLFLSSKAFVFIWDLSTGFNCFKWSDSFPNWRKRNELKFDSLPILQTRTFSEGYLKAPYLTFICFKYLMEGSFWLSPTAKQESIRLIKLLLPWISFLLIGANRFLFGVCAMSKIDQPWIFFRLFSLIKKGERTIKSSFKKRRVLLFLSWCCGNTY